MQKIRVFLLCFVAFAFSIAAEVSIGQRLVDYFCPDEFSDLHISDWNNPSLDDYLEIEHYLRERQERVKNNLFAEKFILPNKLDGLISYRIGRTKITDGTEPRFVKIDFGDNPDQREYCIISYAGCDFGDRNYENGLITIARALERVGFKGHLLYRVGGWPSLQKGRLRFADVPYAFKPFMFEEVRDMGYKHILWLDACCIPIRNLTPIFKHIEKHGYCYFSEGEMPHHFIETWDFVRDALNMPKRDVYSNVITQIVGVSSNHPTGSSLLNQWIDAACSKLPFLSPTGDQFCFSLLIDKNNLKEGRLPNSIRLNTSVTDFSFIHSKYKAFFLHDYIVVDTKFQPSEAFFNKLPLRRRR